MKLVNVVVLFVVVGVACATEELFAQWELDNGKVYGTDAERQYRRSVFEANLDRINRLNNRDSIDAAHFSINSFADRTPEELAKFYLRPVSAATRTELFKTHPVIRPTASASALSLPDAFNWVDQGAVTPVKNQASCGSCWAFGAVGNMEGQWFLHGKKDKGTGKLESLSEQNLVDCDKECMYFPQTKTTECDEGCSGGMEPNAFTHVIKSGGIMSEDGYPYKGRASTCKFDKTKVVAVFSNWSFVDITDEETALREFLYTNGPVSIGVHADEWFYYSSGVFDSSCKLENDHAVLLTGWGQTESGIKFWIIKNSWGAGWGIKGYMHMIRGKNKCGMLEMMSTIIA